MKNLLLVTLTTLTMMITLLLSTGCAKQEKVAGSDWYIETPRAEHEKRFPRGHRADEASDEKCYYVKKTDSYFCQFDWASYDLYRETPTAKHGKRFPGGHPKDVASDENCHYVKKQIHIFASLTGTNSAIPPLRHNQLLKRDRQTSGTAGFSQSLAVLFSCMRHITGVAPQHVTRHHRKGGQPLRGRYRALLADTSSHPPLELRYIQGKETGVVA